MDLIQRVKNICLTPQTEWPVIAAENEPAANLITGYVLPLATLSAVAGLIGGSLIGRTLPFVGTIRTPLGTGLGLAVFAVIMTVVACFVVSAIINALAPTFGAKKNSAQALKVAVYSFTPAWVAGVFQILPVLGVLGLVGALYGIYLLYLGLPKLMECPREKAVGYTAVVVVCAIVISFALGAIGAAVSGVGALAGNVPAAGQEADQTAAFEGLGALLGGGARVDPVDIDLLRPLVPQTFAGLQQTSSSAEQTGLGVVMVSKVEATFDDGGSRSATLEITDTGGMSGLMGLANWMGVQQERESDDGYERTRRIDGRLTHEKRSRNGDDEFAVVVAERFLVAARGRGIDVDALRTAVSGLDLGRLESMQ